MQVLTLLILSEAHFDPLSQTHLCVIVEPVSIWPVDWPQLLGCVGKMKIHILKTMAEDGLHGVRI